MICLNCSKEVPNFANVCGYCGYRLREKNSETLDPTTPPPLSQPASYSSSVPVESYLNSIPQKKSISRWILISMSGILVGVILMCSAIFMLFRARPATPVVIFQPISDLPTPTPPHTPVEPAVTPGPTQTPKPAQPIRPVEPSALPDTPTAEIQQYDTLEFNGEEDLQSWSTVIADGRVEPEKPVITNDEYSDISINIQDSLFFFDIGRKEMTVYSYYESYMYVDIRLDVRIDPRNTNVNKVGMICRYSPELGWYEFRVTNNGPYGIYFAKPNANGQLNYRLLADGNSTNINLGNATNEYSIICKGDDTLELYINGELTRSTSDALKILRTGKAGVSVWSINSLPVRVGFDWIKISEPQ